jgi:F-type H+-transporting ATPase subunit b
MELFQALGLNVKILTAELVNFAVLLFVLWKFGYGPILKFLDERKNKIEQGVLDAKKAGEKLEEIAAKEKEVMKNAKKEAMVIFEKAKEEGEKNKEKIVVRAKEEIGQIINEEKAKMQSEKAQTLKEIKSEISDLVVRSVEKIIEEKFDQKKDDELIKKIVKNLK